MCKITLEKAHGTTPFPDELTNILILVSKAFGNLGEVLN